MTNEEIENYLVADRYSGSKMNFNYFLREGRIKVLGAFKNEFTELFVVYKKDEGKDVYVTGDELGWENYIYRDGLAWKPTLLSDNEAEKIEELLKK